MNVTLKGTLSNFCGYKVISSYNNPLRQFSPGMAWFDENAKPAIFIFDKLLKAEELNFVLAHEAAHIANGDLASSLIDFKKLKGLGNEQYLSNILNDPNYRKTVQEQYDSIFKMELAADKTAYELFGFHKVVAAKYLEDVSLRLLGYVHEHISARISAIGGF